MESNTNSDYQGKAVSGSTESDAKLHWGKAGRQVAATNRFQVNPAQVFSYADLYAVKPKPATLFGGAVTVAALVSAAVYTILQISSFSRALPTTTSYVEWADTQGPFPMTIKCTAETGCFISNRHSLQWSSNAAMVQTAQQRCLELQPNEIYTINITFTQNPLDGLYMIWDPLQYLPGTTPGSGVQIKSDQSCPECMDGTTPLWTPVLGGVYLANLVQTDNYTSPKAPFRNEWFVTYLSADSTINPLASPCAGTLTPAQLSSYTQVSIVWVLVACQLMCFAGIASGLFGL